MKEASSDRPAQLNLFALPNQTTIIFLMMTLIVLGTILVGSVGTPYSIKSLALALLILPLRAFLARPRREFQRQRLVPGDMHFTSLQEEIRRQARKLALPRVPELCISSKETSLLYIFGTLRHWYIAVDQKTADSLQNTLKDPDAAPMAQAKILHELHHFKTGDYWQLGYAGELLRMTFLIMLWAFIFFLGLGSLLFRAKPFMGQLGQYALMLGQIPRMMGNLLPDLAPFITQVIPLINDMNQRLAAVDFDWIMVLSVGATYPFALIGLILRAIYWPKLWRTREFYADAGVIQAQQNILPYLSARTGIPLLYLGNGAALLQQSAGQILPNRLSFSEKLKAFWRWCVRIPRKHPETSALLQTAKDPSQIFGVWKHTAFLVGSLVVTLEILTMTPLTLHHVGKSPLHLPTLAILILVTLNYLLPQLVLGQPVGNNILKIVTIITLLRIFVLFFFSLLFVVYATIAPTSFAEAMMIIAPKNVTPCELNDVLAGTFLRNLIQIIVGALLLLTAFAFLTRHLRRLFTWYRFTRDHFSPITLSYALLVGVSLFLLFTIFPLLSPLITASEELWRPSTLFSAVSGLLLFSGGFLIFQHFDRKYAKICPQCGQKVAGWYTLGKRCGVQSCQAKLHPWLFTDQPKMSHPPTFSSHLKETLPIKTWNVLRVRIIHIMRDLTSWRHTLHEGFLWISARTGVIETGKRIVKIIWTCCVWGILFLDLVLISIAHKLHFKNPLQNPRPILYYAGWIFGSLALITAYEIFRYRRWFRLWTGWAFLLLFMILSNLVFQQFVSETSLPPPIPFFALVIAVTSFWAVLPGTSVFLWYKDLGLPFFAWGLAIIAWFLTLVWRFQGNIFELMLSFVKQPALPWWMPLFLCMTYIILPVSLISFIGYTLRLLVSEFRNHPGQIS